MIKSKIPHTYPKFHIGDIVKLILPDGKELVTDWEKSSPTNLFYIRTVVQNRRGKYLYIWDIILLADTTKKI
jgi:hypothetical protein